MATLVSKAFFWRRMHSLTGIWLTVYIIQHLLINSRAALLIGDDGKGFISDVNKIHELPFLPLLEFGILGVPILIHMIWGLQYLFTAKYNSFGDSGKEPYLPEYSRNHAYTWQRITSWILVVAIIAHVVHMRVLQYPSSAKLGGQEYFMMRVGLDEGLYTLAPRLNVDLYNDHYQPILLHDTRLLNPDEKSVLKAFYLSLAGIFYATNDEASEPTKIRELLAKQDAEQHEEWIQAMERWPLKKGEAIAVAKDFGTAELLMLRETFKLPVMLVLYTIFVLAACFHAFNGMWTFLITWGITVTERSRVLFLKICYGLMILVAGLGLAAVWLTYWVNLKY